MPTLVKKETKFREPALYYLATIFDMYYSVSWSDLLKKKNLALYHFQEGIIDFALFWTEEYFRGNYEGSAWEKSEDISASFLKSIFASSGEDPEFIHEYKRLETGKRREKLMALTRRLEKRGFYQRLCHAWASYFLVVHYDIMYRIFDDSKQKIYTRENGDMVYACCEKPSRKTVVLRLNKNGKRYLYYYGNAYGPHWFDQLLQSVQRTTA